MPAPSGTASASGPGSPSAELRDRRPARPGGRPAFGAGPSVRRGVPGAERGGGVAGLPAAPSAVPPPPPEGGSAAIARWPLKYAAGGVATLEKGP